MAFNGNGLFELDASNPVVTGTTIQTTWANPTLNDIADGLSNCITKDGQTTPTANIPLGGYRITGLGPGIADDDAANLSQVIRVISLADYDAAGNWNGTTGTDDTAAIRAACAALQALGGGVLSFGQKKRYRVHSGSDTDIIGDFSDLTSIQFLWNGSEIVVDKDYSGSTVSKLFNFDNCDNIDFGNPIVSCTDQQPSGERYVRGPTFAYIENGCVGIKAGVSQFTDLRVGYQFHRGPTDAVSTASRVVDLGIIQALRVGYPLPCSLSPYNLKAIIYSASCGRSYFPTGIIDHDVTVFSKNNESSVDCLLATDVGIGIDGLSRNQGVNGLKLRYTNIESTTADNSIHAIRLEIQNSELAIGFHRNVDIELNIQTQSTTYLGQAVQLSKVKSDDTADTVDRGHIIENIKISGQILAATGSQLSIGIPSTGTWGASENINCIDFTDLYISGTAQPTINLTSLKHRAGFTHVYCSAQMNVTGNSTVPIIFNDVVCDASITTSTSDTSLMNYNDCYIGSATNQSTLNKNFTNTKLASDLINNNPSQGREVYSTIPVGAVAYSSLGTAVNHVNGTIYLAEVVLDRDVTVAAVYLLNGGTVGTNSRIAAIYDLHGTLLANSTLAGTGSSGANSFQILSLTANKFLLRGRYYIGIQANGATDNMRCVAASTYIGVRSIAQTGTFGTLASISPMATTFVADVGPIAYVKEA